MFSNKELRHFAYSTFSDWPGGVYATPAIAGSRPGALIAVWWHLHEICRNLSILQATWAALVYHGEDGYIDATKKMVTVARQLADGSSYVNWVSVSVLFLFMP